MIFLNSFVQVIKIFTQNVMSFKECLNTVCIFAYFRRIKLGTVVVEQGNSRSHIQLSSPTQNSLNIKLSNN